MAYKYIKDNNIIEKDAFGDWHIGKIKEDGNIDSGFFGVHSGIVNRPNYLDEREAIIDREAGKFTKDSISQRYVFRKDKITSGKDRSESSDWWKYGNTDIRHVGYSKIESIVENILFGILYASLIAAGSVVVVLPVLNGIEMGISEYNRLSKQKDANNKIMPNQSLESKVNKNNERIYYRRDKNGALILTNNPNYEREMNYSITKEICKYTDREEEYCT